MTASLKHGDVVSSMKDDTRVWVQNDAIERGVIGMMLRDRSLLEKGAQELSAEHFLSPINRAWVAIMFQRFDDGLVVDGNTLESCFDNVAECSGESRQVVAYSFADVVAADASPVEWPRYVEALCWAKDRRELAFLLERAQDPNYDLRHVISAVEKVGKRVTQAGSLPPIRRASEIEAEPPMMPPELIRGILHRSSKLVLGGGSKSFKTWTLLDMALAVASGREWLGFPCERERVLFLNFEVQDAFFHQRVQKICAARSVAVPSDLFVWGLRGHSTRIEKIIPEVIRKVQGEGFGLIVLDPIYKLLQGRDENAAGDIGEAMNELERLAVDSGAAIAFGAHFAKGNASGKSAIDRMSGSGVFARDPDSILTLTPHEEEDCFTLDAILRNHAPVAPFVVRWAFPLMRQDGVLDPAKLKKPPGAFEAKFNPKQVLDVLEEKIMTSKEVEVACQNAHGMSDATTKRLLKALRERGEVVQPSTGHWRLTGSR